MKIMVISGSRNPVGQTARASAALVEGLESGHAEVETVLLPSRSIERCRQCDAEGWGQCRTECRCVIEDDFAVLVEAVRQADAVVVATPVYFSDVSESLRAFLDRLRRIARLEAGKHGLANKPAVALCVAGGGGGGAPACAAIMEKTLRTIGFDLVDAICVRRQNLDMKLGVLRLTGRWLAGLQTAR
jgi:multimeric flavodoxin WrbA